ncbi:MAG: hypothetical protein IT270_03490 [Saprospiraceae bacterium]|nr:hypothetical protein [Saprospiraceae bacterium]
MFFTCSSPQHLDEKEASAWYEKLPPCPCENPDKNGVLINDGWAADKGEINKYHKGAVYCFRSYPYVKTEAGKSGQPCCYDAEGKLITGGSGAGTPDKISTCSGEKPDGTMLVRESGLWGHYFKDVKPWNNAGGEKDGWKVYNKLWVPNNANNCPENVILKE